MCVSPIGMATIKFHVIVSLLLCVSANYLDAASLLRLLLVRSTGFDIPLNGGSRAYARLLTFQFREFAERLQLLARACIIWPCVNSHVSTVSLTFDKGQGLGRSIWCGDERELHQLDASLPQSTSAWILHFKQLNVLKMNRQDHFQIFEYLKKCDITIRVYVSGDFSFASDGTLEYADQVCWTVNLRKDNCLAQMNLFEYSI